MCEEPGCEGLLDVRDPAEGRCVGEVKVCESHFGWFFGGEIQLRPLMYSNWISQCIVGLWEKGCVFRGVRGSVVAEKLHAPIRIDKRRPSAICLSFIGHWLLRVYLQLAVLISVLLFLHNHATASHLTR